MDFVTLTFPELIVIIKKHLRGGLFLKPFENFFRRLKVKRKKLLAVLIVFLIFGPMIFTNCQITPSPSYLFDQVDLKQGKTDISITYLKDGNAAELGMKMVKIGLPLIESFLGEFPSSSLEITSFPRPGGLPGLVFIPESLLSDPPALYHEITHSFWHYHNSPKWFAEASASYIANYTVDKIQEDPPAWWPPGYIDLKTWSETTKSGDIYIRGCLLLIDLHFLIGPEKMSNAYQDLYERSKFKEVDEKVIEEVFLEHSPPELRKRIRDLFKERVLGILKTT